MDDSLAIILLTQKRHGECLLEAATHFTGESPEGVSVIELFGNESRGEIQSHLTHALEKHRNRNVLVLCDLFGSTHASIAADLAKQNGNIACVCGLNLAMLMESFTMRQCPLKKAAERAAKAGKQGIVTCCGSKWQDKEL